MTKKKKEVEREILRGRFDTLDKAFDFQDCCGLLLENSICKQKAQRDLKIPDLGSGSPNLSLRMKVGRGTLTNEVQPALVVDSRQCDSKAL